MDVNKHMPLSKSRQLYGSDGNKNKKATYTKGGYRKRGKLRAAKFAKEGQKDTIAACCKCMYNSVRCQALKLSDGKQCNYCATTGSKYCSKHKTNKAGKVGGSRGVVLHKSR